MAKPGKIVIDHENSLSALATWYKAFMLTPVWSFLLIMPLGVAVRTYAPVLSLPFYFLVLASGLVYFWGDMLKRRVVIEEDKIDFGFLRLPLAELEKIDLTYNTTGFLTVSLPRALVFTFKDGHRFELRIARLAIEDVEKLIAIISRRVNHCRIDPAIEKMVRRRLPPPILRLEDPDKVVLDFASERLLNELPAIFENTRRRWSRLVGPVGTLIVFSPVWLLSVYQLCEVLRDYSKVNANAGFYNALVGIIRNATPLLTAGRDYTLSISESIATSPVVAAFCIVGFLYFSFQAVKAAFGPNKLTIDRQEISLDRFYELYSSQEESARWEDVYLVKLKQPKGTSDPNRALVQFKDRNDKTLMSIPLDGLTQADREKLSLAIAKIGNCPVEAALSEALEPRQEKSYTELWLKSLSDTPARKNLEPLQTGHLLEKSRYEIVRKLAVGGEGVAYLGRDLKGLSTGVVDDVVLKETLIPPFVDKQIQQSALERFEREARLLKGLESEYVVGLRDYFIEDHRCYLVLEYVGGANLRQHVTEGGALAEADVINLARQMAAMLAFLHNQPQAVIHRDFTPDNLILQKNGKLKLIDFNVARDADDGKTGTIVGKHAYVPPEQFRGKPVKQSDIYAFGATLHFLLTGLDPTPISKSRPAAINSTVSDALDSIVQKCTELDCSKRFASIEEVLAALDNAQNPQTIKIQTREKAH